MRHIWLAATATLLSCSAVHSQTSRPTSVTDLGYTPLEEPQRWEGEGMQGYYARAILDGEEVELSSLCGISDPVIAAYEVTVTKDDGEMVEFDLGLSSLPGRPSLSSHSETRRAHGRSLIAMIAGRLPVHHSCRTYRSRADLTK